MNILAIETTGAKASVALINEKGEVSLEASDEKMNHLQNLIPIIDALLKKRELSIDDINYVAVSEGPGSFTGIRIGVASARALAQALGVKTIAVPTLQSFLYHAYDYNGIICLIFDARRNQVYSGAYQWVRNEFPEKSKNEYLSSKKFQSSYKELVAGDAYDLPQLLEKLRTVLLEESNERMTSEVTFFGDGIIPYKKQIIDWQNSSLNDNIRVLFADDDIRLQNASSVARMALEYYREGKIKSLYDLKPAYMRKAEAERKLEEKS
jgi:tRNA threonylcarbamoyladenosine biosynthesis protein TsaB